MQKVAISLSPHLSLYELVNVANVNNIFTERRDILARWCKSLERKVIENRWPVDVFAGFQELDNLAPVFTRYQQIAQVAHSVWVFGRPATLALRDSNIHAVELSPDARLVKEWFLIV